MVIFITTQSVKNPPKLNKSKAKNDDWLSKKNLNDSTTRLDSSEIVSIHRWLIHRWILSPSKLVIAFKRDPTEMATSRQPFYLGSRFSGECDDLKVLVKANKAKEICVLSVWLLQVLQGGEACYGCINIQFYIYHIPESSKGCEIWAPWLPKTDLAAEIWHPWRV